VLTQYPEALDLDNQPLRFLAQLYAARALEGKLQPDLAATALLELETDLVAHSDEISEPQFQFFAERLDAALTRLEPGLDATVRDDIAAHRAARRKKPVSEVFYVHKLSRKLVRAVMDESPYSPRLRYISDVVDGQPYLLAYHFLPDRYESSITGLAGYIVDLPRLSTAVLPGFLQELALSDDAWLDIIDESGNRVIGSDARAAEPSIATSNLGEPFEFWNVAVHSATPAGAVRAVNFRTKVFLYGILLLLLTIGAGAVVVTLGLRREARLTNQKTTFVSNVSHELRTPLTAIRMYAELLEMSGSRLTEAERRRQLAVIRGECGRLERLIDSVLDLASLQRGTKRFEFEYEEVDAVVRAAAEEFREQAQAQGFQYAVDIETDLPEVRLDADAMRQVLLNLLSNALKYSDTERWIAVRAFRRGDEVAVQVEDHGIGIAPRDHQRIFEDFYRVDQRLSTPRQGVGLGLTLVRRIVEAHQGRITVESAPGRGARFTIFLPVEPSEAGGAAPGGRIPLEA
jgi:signal transduction histidine kinase